MQLCKRIVSRNIFIYNVSRPARLLPLLLLLLLLGRTRVIRNDTYKNITSGIVCTIHSHGRERE